jgi:uncharacterized Zn finger protein
MNTKTFSKISKIVSFMLKNKLLLNKLKLMTSVSYSTKRKGYWLFKSGKVKKDVETEKRIYFKVEGETEEHSVIFDKNKKSFICDCSYFSLKFKECSHIHAVKLFIGE